MKLHKSQKRILKAIKEKPDITVRELQEVCKISSPSVVQYHLRAMQNNDVIRKVKISKWEIIGEA